MRWLRLVERRNNEDIFKKNGEIRVKRNWGRGRPKKKRKKVTRKDMRASHA